MYDDGNLIIEKTDQCFTCRHFVGNTTCPLLVALSEGVVEMGYEDFAVQNCAMYEYGLHLRLVELKEE